MSAGIRSPAQTDIEKPSTLESWASARKLRPANQRMRPQFAGHALSAWAGVPCGLLRVVEHIGENLAQP